MNRFLSLALGCGLVALVSGGCSGTAPAGGISDPDGGVLANSPAGEASGGSDVNGDGVPQACERYLSCLLVESPSAYAGAIALYGHNAACWATPQQTANCIKACDASFSDISTKCECTGSTCKAAPDKSAVPMCQTLTATNGARACVCQLQNEVLSCNPEAGCVCSIDGRRTKVLLLPEQRAGVQYYCEQPEIRWSECGFKAP